MSEWLTYAEAAARFGVSAEAVRQIALRRKWPRRKPNDDPYGRVQVLIPDDPEIRPRTPVQLPSEQPSDARSSGEEAWRQTAASERAARERAEAEADHERRRADEERARAEAERGRAERSEQRADQAEEQIGELRRKLDAAGSDLAAAKARGDRLGSELDQARAALIDAEAWQRRPWWRRLRRRHPNG